jgi:hypothetical protein
MTATREDSPLRLDWPMQGLAGPRPEDVEKLRRAAADAARADRRP